MRRHWILGLATLAPMLAGCGEESTGDGDTDIDTDVDTDTDSDTDADGGAFRISYLDLTDPEALDNVFVENLINENITDLTMNWMIELGPESGGSCDFRTGAGLPRPEGCEESAAVQCTGFEYETEYPPVQGTGDRTDTTFGIPAGEGIIQLVEIPVHGDIFILLPLRDATLEGSFVEDEDLCGDAVALPCGRIVAKITMVDAQEVIIEDLGMTLCGLLGADTGERNVLEDDCVNLFACLDGEEPPDVDWVCEEDGRPPDTEANGDPAWTLGGTFEAEPAAIAE